MGGLGTGEMLVVTIWGAIVVAALAIPAVLICRKAGFPPLLGLLAVVPVVNVLLLWYVALAPWPSRGIASGREL